MNFTRSSFEAANPSSSRIAAQQASKPRTDNSGAIRSPMSEGHAESDQDQFASLLEDLKRGPVELPGADGDTGASPMAGQSEIDGSSVADDASSTEGEAGMLVRDERGDAESLSTLDEMVDELRKSDDDESAGTCANELSMFMDAASFASIDARSEAGEVAQSTLPVNEAATRIIDEMQSRARRNESRRWQFSLPGLLGGEVTVIIERASDQSWVVELTTPEGCSDDDRLALVHRLGERLDDVTVTTAAS